MDPSVEALGAGQLVAALEVLELGRGEANVTITLNFTSTAT